jgi:hypothetical protein
MKIKSLDHLENSSLGEYAKEQIRQHLRVKIKVNKFKNKHVYISRCCESVVEIIELKKKQFKCLSCNKMCQYHFFHSKKEYKTFCELRAMEKVGVIRGFQREVPYLINEKQKYVLDYLIQFADGHVEHWDTKGVRTDVYKIKKQLMFEKYGIVIVEK